MENRIICRYDGQKRGPLLICLGGMHGHEPAGILAVQEVAGLLDIESGINEDFQYRGRLLGLRGNLAAIQKKQRFINRDLNRMLTPEEVNRVRGLQPSELADEDKECREIIDVIEAEIKQYAPSFTLILDLHTTTADGGIFTIAAEDEMSRNLAKGLHAPVVLGMEKKLTGTTLNYFNQPSNQRYCIVFEAGRHDDPQGMHRSVAAIINCMRNIGSVDPNVVDHKHDGLLIGMSIGFPKVTRLIYHYKIRPDEHFVMKPGYKNFQQLHAGEELARNENGIVHAPFDGLILMPKYQPQGEDGFFIVEPIEF